MLKETHTELNVTTKAAHILVQGIQQQTANEKTRDGEEGERSMLKTVRMFNELTEADISEQQGWQFMEILKMVRSSQGIFVEDDYIDGASYASLAGEAAYTANKRKDNADELKESLMDLFTKAAKESEDSTADECDCGLCATEVFKADKPAPHGTALVHGELYDCVQCMDDNMVKLATQWQVHNATTFKAKWNKDDCELIAEPIAPPAPAMAPKVAPKAPAAKVPSLNREHIKGA